MGNVKDPDSIFVEQDIEGLAVHSLRQIVDERGAVLQMFRADAEDFRSFGECYFSEVNPGALKGWKCHRVQTQNLAVPVGRVRFVVFDQREDSGTLGHLRVLEIGRPDAYVRLCIPPKVWYGFAGVAAVPSLVANCADLPHDPAESDVRPLDFPGMASALQLLKHG